MNNCRVQRQQLLNLLRNGEEPLQVVISGEFCEEDEDSAQEEMGFQL